MHNENFSRIGLGGGCHWCTEGGFESLIGIKVVNQGYIPSSMYTNSLRSNEGFLGNPNFIYQQCR
jgi:peptide methionine sulfoxide reductase MsrA